MNDYFKTILLLVLVSLLLSACGASPTGQDSASQAARALVATDTPAAPFATDTPQPTSTATCTPTATLVPTATPNLTATSAAATSEAFFATQRAGRTATAVSGQATQQAEDELWSKLTNDGTITYTKGDLYYMDDLEESWAQLNWYRWWSFGFDYSDFVIASHIEWKTPENWKYVSGGCGFVVRIKDNDNHLVVFLTPKGDAELGAMTPRGFNYQGVHWKNPDLPNYLLINPASSGEADLIVVAEKEFVTAYVNGEKIYQWYVALTSPGDMGYTIVSGTNKDFGTNCKFTDTRVWELVK